MIIIAGSLYVDPAERDAYLTERIGVMEHARSTAGCLDFALAPDPLARDRIIVFELWESDADLMRFRAGENGPGPEPGPSPTLRDAAVSKYRISAVEDP